MILEKFVKPVEIATDRFTLRPVRKSDAGLFALYAGDKRVAEATQGIPHPLPPGAAEAFCTRAMTPGTDEVIWVMDGTRSDLPEVLGVISLKTMDRNQSEVAFWVAPAFWNHGIASQAVQALVARKLPRMLALAQRMLNDPVEAEDVAQEAMLRAWRDVVSRR